jgi:exopolyphosphatase / guanosine-5'-triphosphate,3'-diphosphate pyrophosphatase
MTIASIDIGSNTVLLLLAEFDPQLKTLTPITNIQKIPRLSQGLLPNGEISNDKILLLLNILAEFKEICAKYNCSEILINATNAFRYASNSEQIKNHVKDKYFLNIETITGEEEGRLTFLGSAFPFLNTGSKIIIDIGGGSTEIITGNLKGISYQNSFDIGVVSLSERFLTSLPSSEKRLNATEVHIRKIFSDISKNIHANIEAVAVSGTPTTLSCIKQGIKTFNETLVDESIITFSELNEIIRELKKMNANEILRSYGTIVEGREDIILAGALILSGIMEELNLGKIKVSTRGLRYGAIVNYLLKNKLMEMDK